MEQKIFDISKLADSTYFADNRLSAHSDHHYYANEEEMLNEEMSMRQSLNGLWYFSYAKNLASRIEGLKEQIITVKFGIQFVFQHIFKWKVTANLNIQM